MSSNTNIGNTPVNQGYVQLIHTGETGGIDGTLRTLYDGDGTASDLQIASNKVKVSTELYIGSKTATEFIQDIVGDMFTTGSYTNITTNYDDTNGNIDLSSSGEVTLTGTQTLTNKTLASPTFTGTANGANLTLTGDLTVSGDTIFTNSNNVLIGDAILTLNADETGSPTANAGFEVERGTSANKSFVWNETDDKWTIGSETFVAGTVEANLTGNVTGGASLNLLISNNLSDLANASTARSNLGVDAAGTDNSTDVTLAGSLDYITLSGQQITRNAIDLTTDVTGTLPVGNGGTGLTSISTLLNSNVTPTSLGLVIGTNVQAYNAFLADIAGITGTGAGGNLVGADHGKYITFDFSSAGFILSSSQPIVTSGTTQDGLLTYHSSTTATVESNLTFDGTNLDIAADDSKLRLGAGNDGQIYVSSDNLIIRNVTADKDVILQSDDGSGGETAYLTLDGSATKVQVDKNMVFSDNVQAQFGGNVDLRIYSDDSNSYIDNENNDLIIQNDATDKDIILKSDNGSGGLTNYIQLDGSEVETVFNQKIKVEDSKKFAIGSGRDFSIEHDGSHNYMKLSNGNLYFRDQSNNNIFQIYREGGGIQLSEGDLKIPATSKLYFDGGSDTYISETSADLLKIFVGNEAKLEIDEGNENIFLNTNNLTFRTPGFTAQSKFDILNNKLGIGTTSPSAKLEITGSNDTTNMIIGAPTHVVGGGSLSEHNSLLFDNTQVSGASGQVLLRQYANSHNDSEGALAILTTSTGGTTAEAMRIRGSGNVGIGTTSPTNFGSGFTNLQISGSTAGSVQTTDSTNSATAELFTSGGVGYVGTRSNHSFRIKSNDTTAITIDTSQRVGIGNTSPDATFHVGDNSSSFTLGTTSGNSIDLLKLETDSINANQLIFSSERVSDGSTWTSTRERIRRRVDSSNMGYIQFGSSFDATNAHMISFGEVGVGDYMGITGDGKVGIGTESPAVDLHILDTGGHSQLRIETDNASSGAYLELESTTNKYQIYNVGGDLGIDESGVATRFIIKDSTGNVGIGTNSPSYKLQVSGGDIGIDVGERLYFGGGNHTYISEDIDDRLRFFCGGAEFMRFTEAATDQINLYHNTYITGTMYASADVVAYSTSDKRLKDNLKPITNSLEKLQKLTGYEFDWNDKQDTYEGHDVGVIAQEIEEVLPEVVTTRDSGYKAVKYEKIVPLLIEAIKEQQQQIEELKNG